MTLCHDLYGKPFLMKFVIQVKCSRREWEGRRENNGNSEWRETETEGYCYADEDKENGKSLRVVTASF